MKTYNPDVLNCLANLSNDEVFTPPTLANQVLDMLPQELFCNPDTTFLDPVSKSGVFLREIVKRLDRGLQLIIPDRQQRIDHIMRHQVFGIATTELTSYISRRSLYCSRDASGKYSVSHFDNAEGNIIYRNLRHTWQKGKCIYCGASQEVYDRTDADEHYAYQFIHTDNPQKLFPNMKFDVIIGNPPYQLSDGGNSASAKPLYHLFVEQAKKLNPRYLCMIIPSRWFAGGKGLDEFRDSMLKDKQIKDLVYYSDARECFPGTVIGGGVCYFLWMKGYKGNCEYKIYYDGKWSSQQRNLGEYPIFIRFNTAINVVHKVNVTPRNSFSNIVSARNPFGLVTSTKGDGNRHGYRLYSSAGEDYITKNQVTVGEDYIHCYKVMIGRAISGHAGETDENGQVKVLSTLKVIGPNSVCTDTYIVINAHNTKDEAENIMSYLKTKFVRFLVLQTITSINITRGNYQFVPLQDFSHPWTDEMLYKKYGLTEDEIAFIESMIRPME